MGSRENGTQRGGGSGELRQGNLTQILRYLRDHGSSSRHDIARGCGLGVSTMTDLVGDLRARRLVVELDPIRRPGAGRPTRPIALDGAPWCVLGASVEADQVHVVAATVGGEELWQDTFWCGIADLPDGPAAMSAGLRAMLDRIPTECRLVAVQVAVPGHVSSDGLVCAQRVLGWSKVPLAELLVGMLRDAGRGEVHVGVASSSNMAGLHAARTQLDDPSHAVAAYLGGLRDVDGALVIGGEAFGGADGGAGDLAHLNVGADGPGCWCGRQGCLNAFLRTEQLLAEGDVMTSSEATRLVTEQPLKATSVLVEAAEAGEGSVLRALDAAGDALGLVVDDLLGSFNPDAVILGGYLGQLAPYLKPAVDRRLGTREVTSAYGGTQILTAIEEVNPAAAGAVLAARDAVLYDPLTLTSPLG